VVNKLSAYDLLPVTTQEQRLAKDNCVVLFLVGSHLYGTSTPQSDMDYEGIFIESPDYVLGCKSCDEVDFSTKHPSKNSRRNTRKDVDCKLYSLKNFFYLLKKANPNKIEHLFIPERNIVYKNEKYWNQIVEAKDMFLSLKIKHSFQGYAFSQKKKLLVKKQRLDDLRAFKEMLEQGINRENFWNKQNVNMDGSPYKPVLGDILYAKSLVGKFKFITPTMTLEGTPTIIVNEKEYNYGMDAEKIYQQISFQIDQYGHRTTSLDEGGYDYKFASHLFRLYYEGLKLLKEGRVDFPLEENKFLLSVKNGDYDLEYLLKRADEFEPLFEIAYQESKLRHSPDQDGISTLQTQMYLEYWREKGWV
jgi:hypothetical protein